MVFWIYFKTHLKKKKTKKLKTKGNKLFEVVFVLIATKRVIENLHTYIYTWASESIKEIISLQIEDCIKILNFKQLYKLIIKK